MWRLDKNESFSDWTIEVSVANETNYSKSTYHVHKATLGLGPKKSGYFEALLKSGQFSESSDSTSVVELPEYAMGYFDVFLDYMYAQPSDCACLITRNNRRALQYLANYFIVPKLTEDLYKFMEMQMRRFNHMEEYLNEFGGAEDEESRKMLALAVRACASNILHIGVASSLFYSLTPAMFLHIISLVRVSNNSLDLPEDKKYAICKLAIEYFKHHQTNLDVNYFVALAWELYFPDDRYYAGEVAHGLLSIIETMEWEEETITKGIKSACDAVFSRYLRRQVDISDISEMAGDLPRTSVTYTLVDAITEASKKKYLNTNKSRNFDVSCKLMNFRYGQPDGTIIKVPINTIHTTIDYIRYILCRQLNIMGHMDKLLVWNEDKYLDGPQLVGDCRISSETVLEIYDCIDNPIDEDEGEDSDESTAH